MTDKYPNNNILLPPLPPPPRLWCEVCGNITATEKHTNWICRFFNWIDSKKGE